MKLSEMEIHHTSYLEAEKEINRLINDCDFSQSISVSIKSFSHILPSLQYSKKRNLTLHLTKILPFEIVLKYGPPLFEHNAILSILELTRSSRIFSSHQINYIRKAEKATEMEEIARLLWNFIERNPKAVQAEICQEIDASLATIVEIIGIWEELEIINRTADNQYSEIYFNSGLNVAIEGICPNCGVRGRGMKEAFLKPSTCQKCGMHGYYHISNVAMNNM